MQDGLFQSVKYLTKTEMIGKSPKTLSSCNQQGSKIRTVHLWTEIEENEVIGNVYEQPEYLKKRGN